MRLLLALLLLALLGVGWAWWQLRLARAREARVRQLDFPKGTFAKVRAQHPQLSDKDMALVAQGLRQFFLAYLKSGRRPVSMPSQVADDLWHEFILHTRRYQLFCQQAFGRFLHHTPAVSLTGVVQSNAGLRRCGREACRDEHINPFKPTRLPLLFALDTKFNIAQGFRYQPDCGGVKRQHREGDAGVVHCGGDFSDRSFDGGTAGLSDSDGGGAGHEAGSSDSPGGSGGSDGGDGGGCSAGCGGD